MEKNRVLNHSLTRGVNEARSGRCRCQEHEAGAKAKIALIFFRQILHFDPIFSKNEIFG